MAEKKLRLQILTPQRVLYEGEVDSVIVRCIDGDRGILPGHASMATILGFGSLRVNETKQQAKTFTVLGGFAVVQDNALTILSEAADTPDRIDEAQMQAARELAAKKLQEHTTHTEIQRAETALRRALVHMDVSAYSIIKGPTDPDA